MDGMSRVWKDGE